MNDTLEAAATGRPLNILIVDDSAMMRAMIKRVLEAHPVDAMFTDINMPVMTGTELLREIERRGEWQDLVRVIVSTDGSAARREEVSDLRVRCYVEKPFRPEVMRDVLAEVASNPDAR